MTKIISLLPLHCNNAGVPHAFLSICGNLHKHQVETRMVVPSCEPFCRIPGLVESIPTFLKPWYYRRMNAPVDATEKRFFKELRDYDAAYFWTNISLATYQKVKAAGKPIFLERINCYTGKARSILDAAYAREGLKPQHPNTLEKVQVELEKAQLADYLFCPSPEVERSFAEAGIPDHKLIPTTYGWCPKRFPKADRVKPPTEHVNFLFVGSVGIRKGAHLLLRAWEKANLKNARLTLLGLIEPAIVHLCKDILARPDVVHVNLAWGAPFAYPEADVFVFPTLEEGSPLVSYEAMAHGLPVITTEMGAGTVVRDRQEGFVIADREIYHLDALVESMRQMVEDPTLRTRLGALARERAQEYTWEKVAIRRAQLIMDKLGRTETSKDLSDIREMRELVEPTYMLQPLPIQPN